MKIYPIFRYLLFQLDPERAHQLTLNLIRLVGNNPPLNWIFRQSFSSPPKWVQAFGLKFSNPIGLAAGYDKDGLGWRGLACLGFGHIEIGTVTPKPQEGNTRPRLFRLKSDKALINRMGFPGRGEEFIKKQLQQQRPKDLIIGVNIGKNKDTPFESAGDDYLQLFRSFTGFANYLAINVSSPNTLGLRRLQEKQALNRLLSLLNGERHKLIQFGVSTPPILVKLAPDLTNAELDDALQVILDNHIDGIIAANTTITRVGLTSHMAGEGGGLSGMPLFERSLEMVRNINKQINGKLPVIGVGGIFNATSVQKMLDAGAVLVQLYTGLVYEGPGLIKTIMKDLYS